MKYKGIIFDLDGVLCSTDEYHYKAWKTITDQLHIPFDRRRNNLLRGVSRIASFEIILENCDRKFSEKEKLYWTDEKNRVYQELLKEMTPSDLSDEVRNTLTRLQESGMKLGVGSSSKNAPIILERTGLNSFIEAVADGNCITYSKPHPEVFLKAAEKLNLLPQHCLVVEDAHAGVEAAAAGNFDCAGIGEARNNPKALYHLDHFSDLISFCI